MTSYTGSVDRGFLGSEKKQWVEFLPPNERVEIHSWTRPDEFVRYGRRALVGLRANDVKAVSIERLSLSSCRITFNSKVIKFRTWTNSVNVVYFGFPLSISHIRIMGMLQKEDFNIELTNEVDIPFNKPTKPFIGLCLGRLPRGNSR